MAELMLPSEHRARSLATLKTQMELQDAQAKAEAAVQAKQRAARMDQLFQEQGPDIAAGDENALGALARFDPEAAIELGGKATANKKAKVDYDAAVQKLDDDKRAAVQKRVDRIGMALTAVQAASPEVRGIMYQRQRRMLAAEGLDVSQTPEEYDSNWVNTKAAELQSFSERLSAVQASPEYLQQKADIEAKNKPPQGIVTMVSPDGKTSKSFRTGSPDLDAAIQDGWTERQGRGQSTRLTLADGTTVETGDIGGELRPTTYNEIEKTRIVDSNRLGQIQRVRAGFKPEFLRIGTRAGMAWSAIKDRFSELSDDDKAALDEYTTFRADTTDYFNTTIRALTGAALSPGEASRVAATTPVAGEGVFDGDSPTQFKAKMDRSLETIQMALIRENIWRSQGMKGKPWEAMPLSGVKEWVNKRGDEIATELKKTSPNMDKAAVAAEVKARLRREVGYGE